MYHRAVKEVEMFIVEFNILITKEYFDQSKNEKFMKSKTVRNRLARSVNSNNDKLAAVSYQA